jgi:DnaJ family protein B protein 12
VQNGFNTEATTKEPAAKGANAHDKSQTASESAPQASYTPEQVNEIKKMLQLKDFYEILQVPKTATDEEIKKAYRKLALKFHPDKNRAPNANEAFTKVGKAYDCLSNKEKRSFYDQHGNEDPDQHYRSYTSHYHEDFSPEVGNLFRFAGNNKHIGSLRGVFRHSTWCQTRPWRRWR